jgi:hypothetical protein
MKEIGHPILGDPFYATGPARDFPRLMLHAESLKLRHPDGGKGMLFRAPVPVLIPFILAENSGGVEAEPPRARTSGSRTRGPEAARSPHSQPETALISRNSCRPNTPPSRPLPDCLNPPKGEPWREALAIALDHARAHPPRHPAKLLGVARLDVVGQPVLGVVGHGDGMLLVLEGQDRQDRAEDLLAVDRHLGRHVGEDRGADVEPPVQVPRPPGAAGHQPRALVDAGLDQRLDLVELRLADGGPDMPAFLSRGPHRHAFGRRDGLFHRLVVARAFHHHPASAHCSFARCCGSSG